MKKIVVIGLGYVGLPLAILLSKTYKVHGYDISEDRVCQVCDKEFPLNEAGLKEEFQSEHVKANFTASTKLEAADVFIIAVPTPIYSDKSPDLTMVDSAAEAILPLLKVGNLVILESTVAPGTTARVAEKLKDKNVLVAHCPERVLPGNSIYELINDSRIIGGINNESTDAAEEIYKSFVKGEIIKTSALTAEFCKLIENSYRDVNIAFANELSLMADKLGVDVKEAISIANKHPRVNIHNPGIGVGGHCIPIDPYFLIDTDVENSTLMSAARKINDNMPNITVEKVVNRLKDIKDPKIIALGIAYKPNVDDQRESPALEVIQELRRKGYDVTSYDPMIREKAFISLEEIAKDADCLLILVEHDFIIKQLNDKVKSVMRNPIIMRF